VNSLAIDIVAELAPQLGMRLELEPRYRYCGQLVTPDGRKLYFRNTHFDVNGHGSAEIANDKGFAAHFLARMGYPVPAGETFYSDTWARVVGSGKTVDAAYTYARGVGFPVFVKPNSKSLGAGVAKVHNKRELYRALRHVFRDVGDRVALVQPDVPGDDYRIVVFDDEVVAAYRRLPLTVVGDGRATLRELVHARERALGASGRETRLFISDRRIVARLARLGLTADSVPDPGQSVVLLDNANLSTGGEPVDVTEELHPGYAELAVRATRDMGLRLAGVDVIARGPIDEAPRDHVILEMNPGPGLDHYGGMGPRQRERVVQLYERVLRALVEPNRQAGCL
jgi:D-alanine-D-alanine ligase-like ATP-grasp enzyme